MKDIWCTFKAGSLNWEKKLLAKTVLKIIREKIFTHLRHIFTHNQTSGKLKTEINLQCFDHVC